MYMNVMQYVVIVKEWTHVSMIWNTIISTSTFCLIVKLNNLVCMEQYAMQ